MKFSHNKEQLRSSNPLTSVWVSASAGTGKTKILTDRVLKLILNGSSPEKILCLTFTKAAAGEMLERINKELRAWHDASIESLESSLYLLLGRAPTREEIVNAKNLFHILLKSPAQIQIQTIHGFCQTLLRLFPLEASIVPGFEVIDEVRSRNLILKVSKTIFDNPLNLEEEEALSFIETNVHETSLNVLQNKIIDSRIQFKLLIDHFSESKSYENFLKESMNITLTQDEYFLEFINSLKEYAADDSEYWKKSDEYDFLLQYKNYLNQPILEQKVNFSILKSIFLTKLDKPRVKLISSKCAKEMPDFVGFIENVQKKIVEFDQINKTFGLIRDSKYLFVLASKLITSYDSEKAKYGYLDYDDLIYFSNKLLNNSEFKEWVLYKLDGGIDHILIDEAQDTSPAQWTIISSLMQEFYSGSDNNKQRTIFVVGDEKQSIYSFQGADLRAFQGMKDFLYNQMNFSLQPYEIIDLALSYRSAPAIVKFVDATFERLTNSISHNFPANPHLKCFRNLDGGRVEIWPVLEENSVEDLFWPIIPSSESLSLGTRLGNNIASYIKDLMSSKTILPSTGKVITEEDVMILIRKRDINSLDMVRAIQNTGLAISGMDRIILSSSIEAKDIISIAKFVLQPFDDLNLASLLKSPFFCLNDDEIRDIILYDKSKFILENTKSMGLNNIFLVLDQFCELYLAYSLQDFFHIILNTFGYRKKLLSYGGEESSDIINEFLSLVTTFAKDTSQSLQEFIIWFEQSNTEIKRSVEKNKQIRVMTIHGAKGLQAPVVIIADNITLPRNMNNIVWAERDVALWSSSSSSVSHYLDKCKEYNKKLEYEEYLRLLYVAMTRAEDRLVIACYRSSQKNNDSHWYQILQNAMSQLEYDVENYSFLSEQVLIYQNHSSNTYINNENNLLPQILAPVLPNIPLQNPIIKKFTNLSSSENSDLDSSKAMVFGTIFHKVIEDIVRTRDYSIAKNHPMLGLLSKSQQEFVGNRIDKILNLEEFKNLLKSEIKTEVNIGVNINGEIRVGRIDFMAVYDNKIVILDYKTGNHDKYSKLPISYIKQLLFYKDAISKIYKNHNIEAKILWVDSVILQTVTLENQL